MKPTTTKPGVGDGDVALDDEPVQLQLSSSALQFEVAPGVTPSSQKVLLTNMGFRGATLSPIAGNADFNVANDCGAVLDPASSCSLTITPTTTELGRQYAVTVGAAEVADTISTQLTTVEPDVGPRLKVSDTPVYLGDLAPGQKGSAQVTLTNTGTADATLAGIDSKDRFTITSDCPAQLPAKASCTITASFAWWVPNTYSTTLMLSAAESRVGVVTPLTFFTKVYDDPSIVPALVLDPTMLQFDLLSVGQSATEVAAMANQGTAPAVLGKISSSPDFTVSHNCPDLLDIGAACNLQVVFTGRTAGTAPSYDLKITAQSKASANLLLQGIVDGGPVPIIAPVSLSFGDVDVGQAPTKSVTLTNTSSKVIPLKSINVEVGPDVFTRTHDCGDALAPQATCTATVTFAPNAPGPRNGRVRIDTGSATTAFGLQGRGLGAALSASPSSILFGAVPWPSNALVRSVSLYNGGNVPATGLVITNTDPNLAIGYGDCTDTLGRGKTCTLTLQYTPSGPGAFSTSFQVGAESSTPITVSLSGAALLLSSSPSSLTFEATKVGMSAMDQAVVLTNNGPDAVPFDGISIVSGDFTQANNCGTNLAAGNSCLVAVRFSPKIDGPAAGNLSVATYRTGYLNVPLSGAGIPTWLAFSPASASFPRTYANQSSEPIEVTLSNPTADTVAITGAGLTQGDTYFGQSNDCGASLAPGASCTVVLQMTPPSNGTHRGTWSVVSSIGTFKLTMSGAGQYARPELSDTLFAYGSVAVGERASKSVTIRNPSALPLALKSITVSSDEFEQTNDCGSSIAALGSCTASVSFAPQTPGSHTADFTVTTAQGEYTQLHLSGTGVGAALAFSPASVQMGNVLFPGTSAPRSVTVTNSGNVALSGLSFAPADSALAVDSSACSDTLLPSKSCVVSLRYSPTGSGLFATALQVGSDNGGSPSLAVSGRAVALTITPASLTFPATWVGESAADQSVTLTNQDASTLPLDGVSVTAGIANFNQSNNCDTGLAGGASCTITVRFTPVGRGALGGTLTAAAFGSALPPIALSGSGLTPSLVLAPETIHFDDTNVGRSSPSVLVKVSNPTGQTAKFTGISITKGPTEFAQTNDCGTSLAGGASCTITVQMTPTTTTGSSGTLTVASNWGNSIVSLTGQGTQPTGDLGGDVVVTPSGDGNFIHYAINFLATEYGQTSALRKGVFSNKGTGPLTIQGISQVDGLDDFTMSHDCPSMLLPGQYCTLTFQFKPTQSGPRTGGVALLSDTGNYYFDLSGKGSAAQGTLAATTSDDFGMVPLGSSAQRSFTFTNSGDAPVRNLVASLNNADLTFVTNACGSAGAPATVSAGNSCSMTVKYAPSAAGTLTNAVLSTSGTLANGPVTLPLKGSAPTPALAFDATPSPDYGTVSPNVITQRSFMLRNTGQLSDTVAAMPTVTGTDWSRAGGTCNAGTVLAANSACTVIVNVKPQTEGLFTGNITATSTKGVTAVLAVSANSVAKVPTIRAWTIPAKVYGVAPFTLTAPTSDSTGAFVYTSDNQNIATISGNVVTVTGVGVATITATQQPSGIYGSGSTTATLTVSKANPVITFSIPTQTYTLDPIQIAPVTLAATSPSAGALSYSSDKPAYVAISGNVATISATGSYTITVSQEATDKYNAATKTASMVVTGPGGTLVIAGRVWSPKANSAMTWDTANNGCLTMTKGGYSGWRLGTKDELLALGSVDTAIRPIWPYMWASGGTPTARTAVAVYNPAVGTFNGGQSSVFQTCTHD